MLRQLFTVLIIAYAASLAAASEAYLGVYPEDISDMRLKALRITSGVFIEEVEPNSPAQEAGLRKNDIILKIDDYPTDNSRVFRDTLSNYNPGDVVTICYLNGNAKKRATVTLGKRESRLFPEIKLLNTKTKHLGLRLQNLTEQLKEYFGVENGVLIAEVLTETPAERVGLRAGDIIVKVSDRDISSVVDLKDSIKDRAAGELVSLSVIRDGQSVTFEVEVEETDSLFSIDLDNQIIILGKDHHLDFSDIGKWFKAAIPDSTKKEVEKQLEKLQIELNRLRKKLDN